MAGRHIEVELSDQLWAQLVHVAAALGIANPADAAAIGIGEWVAQRKSELDNRDPGQKYFVNEALDELIAGQKK